MKILFLGDWKANTGPSNVNKNFKKYLPDSVRYIKSSNILIRFIEIFIKTLLSEVIIISGFSCVNILSLIIVKSFNKKIIYILHGCISYENEINELDKDYLVNIEEKYLNSAHCILCVSENYMYWFKKHYPKYREKTSYLNNGIEWKMLNNIEKNSSIIRDENTIITMGGGRPQKNNLIVCEAIKLLNEKRESKLKLIVLGRNYRDTEKIKSYDFVDYVGQVNHNKVYYYLKKANIFILNSFVESFGLALFEALMSGCNILASKDVGAICIINTIKKTDIINDCTNSFEVAEKIEYLLKNSNNKRLLAGIDRKITSCEYAADRLINIIQKLLIEENR